LSKYYKVKDYVCPFCGKDFKKERQLKSHYKDVHQSKHVTTNKKDTKECAESLLSTDQSE